MADEPENLVLVWMRRLDTKFDRMVDEMQQTKGRLTNVETVVAALATEFGALVTADTRMQHAMDRMSDRLERMERRLDLVDDAAPPP